jgi:putative NAD(P)-binding protein
MSHPMRVLVTGATGRVGRAVVDSLTAAGVPVRALTRHPEAAELPANVEIVTGDLTVPESLDAALRDVGAVFLVWTVPLTSAPAVVERVAARARRVVFLSSPHQTPPRRHPSMTATRQPSRRGPWPGRGHAARRVGRGDGKAGVRHPYGVGHPRIGAAVPPVGGRSRRCLYGRCRVRLRRTAGLRRRDRLGGADGDQQAVGS